MEAVSIVASERADLIGLDRRRKNNHVRVNVQLLVSKQVGGLHLELSVFRHDFSDHALDVMHAVFLDRSAVELIEVLAGRAHVDIEHIDLRIGIFFAA